MEFWGVEVKAGESLKVEPGVGMVLHISQACFGEVKKDKGNEFVHLYAKKDGQKFLLGNLSLEKFPHLNFDLVFEDDFELLHDWKHGSVHFAGYRSVNPAVSSGDEEESDDDLGEPIPINAVDNGKPEDKKGKPAADQANAVGKPDSVASKPKVKIVEDHKFAGDDDDEDNDDSEGDDSDEDAANAADDSDDNEDESDEETPKKAKPSKKRSAESATTTAPASNKKAKMTTPQKTDDKKASVHVATPHPSKQAGKPLANSGKPNQQMPKSGGSFSCNLCNRSFGSEQGLQSHSKAKHGK